MSKSSKISKLAVWVLMGLLFVGLAGFGATNLSGTARTIGQVGDKAISVDDYARDLRQEIRTLEAQTGQALPFPQAQALGLDQAVLARLVTTRALDHEATQMGLSIGDDTLRDQILAIPAFAGLDGRFDRENYRFVLEQSGRTEAQFEASLRDETARSLLQGAIVAGIQMPDVMTDTLVRYLAQTRGFVWARLDQGALEFPIPAPTEAEIEAFYEENIDAFTLPETKNLTVISLTPEMIMDRVDVDQDALRALYEDRSDAFNTPERRLVERLVFPDDEAASSAKAALEVGGTTFEALVRERGLDLADADMGDVTQDALGDAGASVFAAQVGTVVGPLETSLGPALFRVNGVLPAQITRFEEALPQLRDQLAADRARRVIAADAQGVDDLLAGGATLEEVAAETDLVVSQMAWTAQSDSGMAAYEGFRAAAATLSEEDFPQVIGLEEGGIFAFRLDEVLPPRPAPLADVRDDVRAAWLRSETQAQLRDRFEPLLSELQTRADLEALDLELEVETELTRGSFVGDVPEGFLTEVFAMTPGQTQLIGDDEALVLVHLETVSDPEPTDEMTLFRDRMTVQMHQALAQDVFEIFARDVQLRAEPRVDPAAINAVHANFQ